MKERTKGFISGVAIGAISICLSITALAATGAVTFNASNLSLNGTQISAKGENYTLANGQSVPASITYTDEKGGGTTYLPVRRIAELMGVETGWDGTTGSVTVKGEVKAPAQPTTPPDTTASTDYSDWSKEDEAAYQEWKALWTIDKAPQEYMNLLAETVKWCGENVRTKETDLYHISFNGAEIKGMSSADSKSYYSNHLQIKTEKYYPRLVDELSVNEKNTVVSFRVGPADIFMALKLANGVSKVGNPPY